RRGEQVALDRVIQAIHGNGSTIKPTQGSPVDRELCEERADALYEVLAAGEMSVSALMAAVRDHPAWRGCGDNAKLNQLVRDRLNAMQAKGRILDRHERGGRLRFVRRAA